MIEARPDDVPDLHLHAGLAGDVLTAAAAGRVTVLTASHQDLIRDGRAASDAPDEIMTAMEKTASEGGVR